MLAENWFQVSTFKILEEVQLHEAGHWTSEVEASDIAGYGS
jgi:hypothetical protein